MNELAAVDRAVEAAYGYLGLPYVFAGGDLTGPTGGGFGSRRVHSARGVRGRWYRYRTHAGHSTQQLCSPCLRGEGRPGRRPILDRPFEPYAEVLSPDSYQ